MCRDIDAAKLATAQEGVTAWAEKLLEDAERYRWLRSQYAQGKQTYFAEYCSGIEIEIDKTIDAEIERSTKSVKGTCNESY